MRANLAATLVLACLLSACTPVAVNRSVDDTAAPAVARGPKVLRIALGRQIEAFVPVVSGAVTTTGGGGQVLPLVSNKLQNFDERGNNLPELAVALPSVAAGTWRINPDGTMETIWTLRPNLKWHDGMPVTADDLAFGYRVVTTPG